MNSSPCCSQISPVRGVTSSLCSGVPRFVAPLRLTSFLLSLQFPTLSLLATLTFLRSAGVLCPVPLLGLSDVFLLSRRVVGAGEDNHGRRQRDSPLPMGPLSPGQEGVCQCFPCRVTRSAPPPHICIWEEGHHVPPMGKERGFVFRLLGAQQLHKSLGVLHGRFVCPPHLLSGADTCIRMDSRVFILYFGL